MMHQGRAILALLIVAAIFVGVIIGIAPSPHSSTATHSATHTFSTSITTQSTVDVLSTVDILCAPESNQQAVSSFSGVPQIVIGNPTSCRVYDQGSRAIPSSWILYQVIPVTVYAPTSTILTLSVPDLPSDSWAHFGTNPLVVSPAGANTTLTVMGVVVPPGRPERSRSDRAGELIVAGGQLDRAGCLGQPRRPPATVIAGGRYSPSNLRSFTSNVSSAYSITWSMTPATFRQRPPR